MKVGLLIIASEVLNGKVKDANTHFLAEYLRNHNMELEMQITVKDEVQSIHDGMKTILKACDVLVTSGGVGPTRDDITKESLGSFFQRPNLYSLESHKIAEANYTRMGRPYPGADHVYSSIPEGFIPLNNSTGFAPGYFFEQSGKLILSGPGVPREFKSMIQDHFPGLIHSRLKSRELIELVVVRTKKVPEEKIFNQVDPELWNKLSEIGAVSSLPVIYGVDIAVKIKSESESNLSLKKSQLMKILQSSPIWPSVWHIGHDPVEAVIVEKAKALGLTFGFAESATGGLCSERITNVPGSSSVFFGSIVCYDTSVKLALLSVKQSTINDHGVVSTQAASEMASGLTKALGVQIGVSITGIAGPGGGTDETPVGTVCIGLDVNGTVTSERFEFKGDREALKNRFSQAALMTLLEAMEKIAS